ncbi:MAG: DNA-binding response regulator [Thermoleophilia bacterium]|nr:DNA-binding response regulator [Thermoleophilia bacterium]
MPVLPKRPDGPAKVLVIDDEYGARLQVELAIMTSDVVELVGEASNGMTGAERAEELQPDVIVLDLSMPVMDGFEAIPLLRTIVPRATILIRSNNDDPDAAAQAFRLGAAGYIQKMASPDALRTSIEEAATRSTPATELLTDARSLEPRGHGRPRERARDVRRLGRHVRH